jgi:hypothetical protein
VDVFRGTTWKSPSAPNRLVLRVWWITGPVLAVLAIIVILVLTATLSFSDKADLLFPFIGALISNVGYTVGRGPLHQESAR